MVAYTLGSLNVVNHDIEEGIRCRRCIVIKNIITGDLKCKMYKTLICIILTYGSEIYAQLLRIFESGIWSR